MSLGTPRSAVAKSYRHGTHRAASPSDTLARARPFVASMGITRVANVTGLDRIGIPVVMVCRPNSRSLAVSQGKGLTLDAAKASGLMESIEAFHAEHVALPREVGSWSGMRRRCRVADVHRLCRVRSGPFHPELPLAWVEGIDLMRGDAIWVPYEVVHTDFTEPAAPGAGCFVCGSNGLASGNHMLEAVAHGLCELVERDAMTLWRLRTLDEQLEARIDARTVHDAGCRALIDACDRAGVSVAVWDMSTDIGLPAFFATLIDRDEDPLRRMLPASGHGCHPCREVALMRAVTEAAQARLTIISGARDDLPRGEYARLRAPEFVARQRQFILGEKGFRDFRAAPTFEGGTFDDDVAWILDRLRAAGIEQAVAVDLSQPDYGLPVVRVVVPGLECAVIDPARYAMGERARVFQAGRVA